MSSVIEKNHRENAEVYTDPVICKQKSLELLEEINMPRGLLPLEDILEVGRNHETGFVWLKQKKAKEHRFKKIGKLVWYDTEVTAFVDDRRMKKLTGVKSKELLIWILSDEMQCGRYTTLKGEGFLEMVLAGFQVWDGGEAMVHGQFGWNEL